MAKFLVYVVYLENSSPKGRRMNLVHHRLLSIQYTIFFPDSQEEKHHVVVYALSCIRTGCETTVQTVNLVLLEDRDKKWYAEDTVITL